MDRPYLVLWFAIALFAVLGAWGIYHLMTAEPEPPQAPPAAATQPLVERLRAERERRLQQRPPSTTSDSSQP